MQATLRDIGHWFSSGAFCRVFFFQISLVALLHNLNIARKKASLAFDSLLTTRDTLWAFLNEIFFGRLTHAIVGCNVLLSELSFINTGELCLF
jgi:hypothetical protein